MNPADPSFLPAVYGVRNMFSGKWMLAIAVVLLNGPMHYKDILSAVRALNTPVDWSEKPRVLHESVLTRTLHRMTADELLIRDEEAGIFPPSVRYALSPATSDALEATLPLAEWADAHQDLIGRAKQRRLRQHSDSSY